MAVKNKRIQKTSIQKSEDALLEQTQAKLKQSEHYLFQMVEAMPQMVWIAKPDGYREFFNKHWYEFTGITEKQSIGDGWTRVFHPEDKKHAIDVWRRSVKTGEQYQIEYRIKNAKTDEWQWVLGRALPLRDDKGKIVKWVGTLTDIDEQKRTAQSTHFLAEASKILSSSLDFKKTLSNIARLAVPGIADWCAIEMMTNNGTEQLIVAHKDPKKVKFAKEVNEKYPTDPDAKTGVPQVLRSGKSEFYPVIPDEMLAASAKDEQHLALIRKIGFSSAMVVPIIIDKKAVGAITFVSSESQKHFTKNDLTMAEELANRASFAIQNARLYAAAQDEIKQRKKLEAQLITANEHLEQRVKERTEKLNTLNVELKRSNNELEDFAYVASHDLQEPLRKIQAFGNLLEEEYADKLGDGKDYIDRMQHAAGRLRTLIDDLLSFSRVTTKAQDMKLVDLNTIIADTLSDMEVRVEELQAKVTIDKLPKITADPTQMRQLFQNLISNALKFHKPDVAPVVKITCERKDKNKRSNEFYAISVTDNGIGFDEKYVDRIFTVFQRLHGKEEYEGTGVGLAVVRKIMERHGGSVSVKSKPGKGATFILSFPIEN